MPLLSQLPATRYPSDRLPVARATLQAGQAALAAQGVTSKANADGSKTYTLAAGAGNTTYSLYRFGAANLSVRVGDSVTWTNADPVTPLLGVLLAGIGGGRLVARRS